MTVQIRNRTMEKIELTKEQINYIRTYVEDELDCQMGGLLIDDLSGTIQNAVDAYNGGAR